MDTFTIQQGLALGLTRATMRSRRFTAPFHGVRVEGPCPTSVDARCHAALPLLPDDAAFSHVTALALLGVEVPWRLQSDPLVHVTTRRRETRPHRPEIAAHLCTQAALDIVQVGALPVTSPEQTWLQLAHYLPLADVVVLGDAMLRRVEPVTDLGRLESLMLHTHKMRGLTACRAALELMVAGTDSTMETRTRLVLVAAGLPCPEVNTPVYDDAGHFVALPDLQYHRLKIAIEYDGDVHRTDPAAWRRDIERCHGLEDAGWLIITATADDVLRHPERLVARVSAAVRRRSGEHVWAQG
ncbi:hypothetical protein SAMN05216410_2116 [Sanguibacter gelidistatuariae]|uniref:DUF559 domain-containing protein n=1 Tax=Sanguibacter gelidistatuariae TaxID=1814289 RepID=A0A1G6ND50_9MICO|nr:hypothetical protein [Sanguibacter gelidistatuariae]SDC65753.1 hypothetical protein SAMN05216410_2116 [Sanguibacter gelidistatuariae]